MSFYDYLIIGSGFFGSICAYELKNKGYDVCVIDKRNHIGGNCYTNNVDGINVHIYGPHIFHTDNKEVWNWINKFVEFNNFRLSPVAFYKGEYYSLPFNMWTFTKLYGNKSPNQIQEIIQSEAKDIGNPTNLEEQAIKFVGRRVYETLVKGYTEKQWRKPATELPKEIIKRLPVRFTFDNNYFNDRYQGIPIGGYTQIFHKLLQDVDVILNTDYFEYKDKLPNHKNLIYTGPIDKFFDYKFGELEYKTTEFKHYRFNNNSNSIGTAVTNFTDVDIPLTRLIEHKHFENVDTDFTIVTEEYPIEYTKDKEPYYPVNDKENNAKYQKYKSLADALPNTYFGGRLAEYKYYDMDDIIERALNFCNELLS
jgi:UDP-galactopyranose mutase